MVSIISEAELNWIPLFNFQKSFREDNGITAACFLRHLNLPMHMAQYLYTHKVVPSIRPASLGRELRVGIFELKKSSQIYVDDSNFEECVEDSLCKHMDNLKIKDAGVSTIITHDDRSVTVVAGKHISKGDAKDILVDMDKDLFQNTNVSAVKVFSPLAFYDSPICIKSNMTGSGFGTGTIALSEDGIFGVTAKHVMVGSDKDSKEPRVVEESETDKDIEIFGKLSNKCYY